MKEGKRRTKKKDDDEEGKIRRREDEERRMMMKEEQKRRKNKKIEGKRRTKKDEERRRKKDDDDEEGKTRKLQICLKTALQTKKRGEAEKRVFTLFFKQKNTQRRRFYWIHSPNAAAAHACIYRLKQVFIQTSKPFKAYRQKISLQRTRHTSWIIKLIKHMKI